MTESEKIRKELLALLGGGPETATQETLNKMFTLNAQLAVAEKAEAQVLKVKANAEFEVKSAARLELTARIKDAIGKVTESFKGEVVKLVGLDEAVIRWSVDYKNGNLIECSILRTKTRAPSTGGNGKRGKIQALFDEHATDAEKQALVTAITEARAQNATARVDGIEYKHRTAVEKRLIVAGTIQPRS